jgi:ferritin-like metal-binding protein YciE
MTVKSMNDLFLHTLKDIYYAEKQIYKNLPKMAKSAESPDLKRAFEKHREETEHHIERLETIFDQCGVAPRAIRCDAMDGILAEAKDVMEEIKDGQVHDAGMLAAAQTVEHYEIARYGTLIAWANQLGMKEASKLLGETLDEEKKTDQLLTRPRRISIRRPRERVSAF